MTHDWRGFLHDVVPAIIQDDLLYKTDGKLDVDAWRDEISEVVWQYVDGSLISYSDHQKVIDEYETHELAPNTDDIDQYGQTFKASEWENARAACAHAIATTVLEGLLSQALDHIADIAVDFSHFADELGCTNYEAAEATLTCPHGWAAHDTEEEYGEAYCLVWKSGQLDGLNGVACEVEGVWLSVCWDPKKKKEVTE